MKYTFNNEEEITKKAYILIGLKKYDHFNILTSLNYTNTFPILHNYIKLYKTSYKSINGLNLYLLEQDNVVVDIIESDKYEKDSNIYIYSQRINSLLNNNDKLKNIIITYHAIEQFLNRSNVLKNKLIEDKINKDELQTYVKYNILKSLNNDNNEIFLHKDFKITKLITTNYVNSKYFKCLDVIIIIENDNIIKTIYDYKDAYHKFIDKFDSKLKLK